LKNPADDLVSTGAGRRAPFSQEKAVTKVARKVSELCVYLIGLACARRVSADSQARDRQLICLGFVTLFFLHALNYAYFFVDDEAIPFVCAQNLLNGHGLTYTHTTVWSKVTRTF
jgi:hypothetical protein